MKHAPHQPPALALFIKSRTRIQYGILFALSLLLIVLGRIDHPFIGTVNRGISTVVTPIVVLFDSAVTGVVDAVSWVQGLAVLERENAELREENSRLQQWRFEAERLAIENRRLQEVLNVRPTFVPTLVTARVLAVAGGSYSRSILIHAGSEDGVREGLPVVDEAGLVGRTIRVGPRGTRVLLMTDVNSRIPVQTVRSRENAIVVGRNDDLARMLYLPSEADVAAGDAVVTSGHGGMFPADLQVGVVESVEEGLVLVRPSANLANLDFVRVLDYGTGPLEPAAER